MIARTKGQDYKPLAFFCARFALSYRWGQIIRWITYFRRHLHCLAVIVMTSTLRPCEQPVIWSPHSMQNNMHAKTICMPSQLRWWAQLTYKCTSHQVSSLADSTPVDRARYKIGFFLNADIHTWGVHLEVGWVVRCFLHVDSNEGSVLKFVGKNSSTTWTPMTNRPLLDCVEQPCIRLLKNCKPATALTCCFGYN
jgi:hypothetical protein